MAGAAVAAGFSALGGAAIGGGDINLGGNEDVTTVSFDLALNSAPYIVPAV